MCTFYHVPKHGSSISQKSAPTGTSRDSCLVEGLYKRYTLCLARNIMLLCLMQRHKRSANQSPLSISAPICVVVIYVCRLVCGRLDQVAVSNRWLRRACPSVGLHGVARLPLDGLSWWGTLNFRWLGMLSVRRLAHHTSRCHFISHFDWKMLCPAVNSSIAMSTPMHVLHSPWQKCRDAHVRSYSTKGVVSDNWTQQRQQLRVSTLRAVRRQRELWERNKREEKNV